MVKGLSSFRLWSAANNIMILDLLLDHIHTPSMLYNISLYNTPRMHLHRH